MIRSATTAVAGCLLLSSSHATVSAQTTSTETVVIFRHAEKPASVGLGQLTCQGLNRALALPPVLQGKFGTPNFLFAPDPGVQVSDDGSGPYSYVRPLATIEPTAISYPLPVSTEIGYNAVDKIVSAATQKTMSSATVFIAWEHTRIGPIAKGILEKFHGDESKVPGKWDEGDFDSIYVIRIDQPAHGTTSARFEHDHEGLDGQSADCPAPAPKGSGKP